MQVWRDFKVDIINILRVDQLYEAPATMRIGFAAFNVMTQSCRRANKSSKQCLHTQNESLSLIKLQHIVRMYVLLDCRVKRRCLQLAADIVKHGTSNVIIHCENSDKWIMSSQHRGPYFDQPLVSRDLRRWWDASCAGLQHLWFRWLFHRIWQGLEALLVLARVPMWCRARDFPR
jgi:hypothetical protein